MGSAGRQQLDTCPNQQAGRASPPTSSAANTQCHRNQRHHRSRQRCSGAAPRRTAPPRSLGDHHVGAKPRVAGCRRATAPRACPKTGNGAGRRQRPGVAAAQATRHSAAATGTRRHVASTPTPPPTTASHPQIAARRPLAAPPARPSDSRRRPRSTRLAKPTSSTSRPNGPSHPHGGAVRGPAEDVRPEGGRAAGLASMQGPPLDAGPRPTSRSRASARSSSPSAPRPAAADAGRGRGPGRRRRSVPAAAEAAARARTRPFHGGVDTSRRGRAVAGPRPRPPSTPGATGPRRRPSGALFRGRRSCRATSA